MNALLSQRVRTALPWLLLAVFALNFARGLTPFVMVEGDEQGVLNGVRELATGHPDPRWMYLYPVHAGSHQFIRALVALGVPSPAAAFGILTVLGGVGSFIAAGFLAARLINVRWIFAALWLAAIPEMSSACFYLNTSAVAGPFAWGALCLAAGPATRGRALAIGLLLAVAGWMRIDALGLSPAVPLLWWRFDRPAAVRATVIAAVVAFFGLLLLWRACGIGLTEVAAIWSDRMANYPLGDGLRVALLAIGPVMLLAFGVACFGLIWRREFWWLLVVSAIAGPTLFAHGRCLTTPKYLYFILPVLAMVSLGALRDAWNSPRLAWRFAAGTVLVMLAFDWFSGVRSWALARQRFRPDAPLATLAHASIAGANAAWVVGSGELIGTDDGYRLRGGYWFAPSRWRRDKQAMSASAAQLADFAKQTKAFGFVTCGWVARQAAVAALLEAGFSAGPVQLRDPGYLSDYLQDWTAPDGRDCRQLALGTFSQDLLRPLLAKLSGRDVLLVSDQMWRPKNDSTLSWSPLPGPDDGIVFTLRATVPTVGLEN